MAGGSGRRRVTGSRRRPASSSAERSRASAPRRWTTSTGSAPGTGSSSSGSSSGGFNILAALLSLFGAGSAGAGGCLPRTKGCGLIGIIGLVIIAIIVVIALQQCGGCDLFTKNPTSNPTTTSSGTVTSPTVTNPTTTYTPSGETHQWLVMLYQGADDNVLEKDIYVDLNEAEMVGSSEDVMIVAQIDRYNGGYSGDGNWTETRRYIVQRDQNLEKLASQQVGGLGELNMASSQTLVDFAMWAIQTYPADRYALIMSDHGMGWPGGWTDASSSGGGDSSIPIASAIGEMIYLHQLDDALSLIRTQTGIDKLDIVGLDACLMAQLEVFTALAPHAHYCVASEEVEPALGWAYAGFLGALSENPAMDGAELSQAIVESYIDDDRFVSSAFEKSRLSRDITLTAVDLGRIGQLNSSLNGLLFEFQNASQKEIAAGRTYARSYTSVFGSAEPPSYIDLANFLQIVKQNINQAEVNEGINSVLSAINQTVVAEKHGVQMEGSSGISIYFPNSSLYKSPVSGAKSYTAVAERFAAESLWDDFLSFHYTGRSFELGDAGAVVPDSGSVASPASGVFSISSLVSSADSASWRRPVTLTADISGQNIGYIYLFAGFLDEQSNSLFIADRDYIESPDIRLIDGVYYPDWGEGDFTLEFAWEPIVFAINDENNSVIALFNPESYGLTAEEAVYSVDGIYHFTGDNTECYARMYFSAGEMQKVVGFTGSDGSGAPREITTEKGDSFTVLDNWLDLDSFGNVINADTKRGGTLTFTSSVFTWEVLDAPAGSYKVGFVVEDLDGKRREALLPIEVVDEG
ncbi:MAG: clostripain-related cysteine peptidase [Dehalococcoidales bacterium]|nr:clostripain-related cysteine peptidase [Dehalococcoidales bacterium]